MKNKILLTLTLLIAMTMGANANIVFSDSFNYADGSIVTNSSGVWTPNSGAQGTQSVMVTNQQLIVTTSGAEDIANQFPTAFTTNGAVAALYSSFKLKCVGKPTLAGTYFAHFTGSNGFNSLSGFRARLWATTTNVAALSATGPTQFMLSIANSGVSGGTNGQWIAPLETNVVYTVVTRYELGTGLSTLWINPNLESDTHVVANDIIPVGDIGTNGLATNGLISITHYGFRQAGGEGTMYIDDLKIGTSFTDVAGANTSPTISAIPNQSIPANTALGPISFTVGDGETAATSLNVTASSGNGTLVPNANISLGGSGANRTITINPANNQQGSVVITVSVSDGVNTTATQFPIIFGAPSIAAISSRITSVNQGMTVPVTVGDTESAAGSLTVTATSSNTGLLPNANIVVGGSGANRTLTLTPVTDQIGTTFITVSVTDGINTTQTTFTFTVRILLGLVFSDEFDYEDGSLYQNSSVWINQSGTGSQMQVVGGEAIVNSTLTEDLKAVLTNSPFATTSGVVLYCSFKLKSTSLPTTGGGYFMHYKDPGITGTAFRAKVFASTANAASGSFRIGIANSANSVTPSSQFPLDLSLNTTYTVVTRYNVGTGESQLWINPSSENDAGVSAADGLNASVVQEISLREDTGMGVINIDSLKVGTSFTDVSAVVVIPTLTVQKTGSDVVISWSDAATGYTLETTSSLSPASWSTVSQTVNQAGGSYSVTIPSATGNQFYRLKK